MFRSPGYGEIYLGIKIYIGVVYKKYEIYIDYTGFIFETSPAGIAVGSRPKSGLEPAERRQLLPYITCASQQLDGVGERDFRSRIGIS